MSNQAITLTEFGGADTLKLAEVPVPQAQTGTVVVGVRAAGINGLDWKIREGYMRDIIPTVFPAVLGLELAGEVAATAPGSRFAIGDRVFGLAAPGNGAYAEQVAVAEFLLADTPSELTDVQAAAIPVAGLTAWQMLHAAGTPQTRQTVLVHGAAGGVGTILVQLAKQLGLRVVATASATSRAHLADLGVDQVIDRGSERFEEQVNNVDLVIDLAGADAPDRSWAVLREGGTLVSSVRPDIAAPREDGRKGIWFTMQPDAERIRQIADAVASGTIKLTVGETVSLAEVPAALERNRTGHKPGKAVADLTLA
jgi:NADPH:quinone reductase-like Zn-dependent oxidoreductase